MLKSLLGARWVGILVIAGLVTVGLMLPVVGANPSPEAIGPGDLIFQTVSIPASEDTTLHSWFPHTNFGSDPILSVRSQGVASPIIKFNFDSLANPDDVAIARATLRIFVQSGTNPLSIYASAFGINRDWVEDEATWYKADADTWWAQPGCRAVPLDRSGIASAEAEISGGGEWISLDVTEAVRSWFTGDANNYGIILTAYAGGSVGYDLFGADYADAALRPYLQLLLTEVPTPTPTPVFPGLSIVKEGPTGPLNLGALGFGEPLDYEITVSNNGTGLSENVIVEDLLPTGVSLVAASDDAQYSAELHSVVWPSFDLAVGETKVLTLQVALNEWIAGVGSINNVARAQCDGCNPVEDSWQTLIYPPTPTPTPIVPNLLLVKTGPSGPIKETEQEFTYNISVSNMGNGPATGVVVTDSLPLGVAYDGSDPSGDYDRQNHTVTWSDLELQPGESLDITLHVKLAAWVGDLGYIVNTVEATCAEVETVARGSCMTRVEPTVFRLYLSQFHNRYLIP